MLIVNTGSTFSQMAGMLAQGAQVHYPVTTLPPRITLVVPGWRYHWATPSRDGIREFDVAHARLGTPVMWR